MKFGLFILLLVLVAAGLVYVYLKVLDNPEERFRKKSLMGLDKNYGATFPPFYYYLKIMDGQGKLVNDMVINPDTLLEGEDNHIGRIVGNPDSKKFKEKLAYKLDNKDLFFGIRTPSASSLGHKHLQLFKDNSFKLNELAIQCEHQNGMYLVLEDGSLKKTEQVIITDYDCAVIEAGGYCFSFEKCISGDPQNDVFFKEYIERHTGKTNSNNAPKKKRNNPYATRTDDVEQSGTKVAGNGGAASGGGRKIRR